MTSLSVAVLQMTGDIDPAANARTIADAAERAAGQGATLLLTPEMSNLIDRDRVRAAGRIGTLADDTVIRTAREAAARHGIAIALGSVAVRDVGEDRLSNRSVFIDEGGAVLATYDKMHLFDVTLGRGDDWRESAAYRAGDRAVTVDWAGVRFGLSVCYDLRFPALYQALSGAGAQVLLVPAAFTRPTGAAHWRTLLSARAIENAAFVIAAAHTGDHADGRATWGHSMAIDPWGEVLLEMGEAPGLGLVTLDLSRVAEVRAQVDVIGHRREVRVPE